MRDSFWIVFLLIDICGCLTNFTTLVYISKTFNIRTHVFTLICLDSLNSTIGCIISSTFYSLFFGKQIQPTSIFCFLSFFSYYLPNCFGAILTLLIALIRYCLAKKSARNIHPSNKKVTAISIAIFTVLATTSLVICLTHALLDLPLTFSIEVCARSDNFVRPISPISFLLLLIPNICNFLSLFTDIKMMQFLKQVVVPSIANRLSGLGAHF